MSADGRFPEHEKMAAVQEHTQVMGEWVSWLQAKGYVLAEYGTGKPGDDRSPDRLYAVHSDPMALMAEFFDIDPVKVETEKRAMLDEMRRQFKQAETQHKEDTE
jgi:hypothetical protein